MRVSLHMWFVLFRILLDTALAVLAYKMRFWGIGIGIRIFGVDTLPSRFLYCVLSIGIVVGLLEYVKRFVFYFEWFLGRSNELKNVICITISICFQ